MEADRDQASAPLQEVKDELLAEEEDRDVEEILTADTTTRLSSSPFADDIVKEENHRDCLPNAKDASRELNSGQILVDQVEAVAAPVLHTLAPDQAQDNKTEPASEDVLQKTASHPEARLESRSLDIAFGGGEHGVEAALSCSPKKRQFEQLIEEPPVKEKEVNMLHICS